MRCAFLIALLVVSQHASGQPNAVPSENSGVLPAVGAWKSLDPMLVGPASTLFRSDMPFIAPTHACKLPKEIQRLRAISICPDGSGVLIFTVLDGNDSLVKVDVNTGATLGEPTKFGKAFRQFTFCRSGANSLLVRSSRTEISQVDSNSGKVIRTFDVDGASLNFCAAADGASFAIDTPSGVEIWDLVNGKSRGIVRPEGNESIRLVPVALPSADKILACHMDGDKANFVVLDATTKRKLAESQIKMGPFAPSSDLSCMLIASIESAKWEKAGIWNTTTLEKMSESTLSPSLAAISQKLGPNGRLLLLQEYMVQPILVFDTKKSEFIAALGPDGYGSVMFDVSPDWRSAASIVGPWINGDLQPGWIAVYDLKGVGR